VLSSEEKDDEDELESVDSVCSLSRLANCLARSAFWSPSASVMGVYYYFGRLEDNFWLYLCQCSQDSARSYSPWQHICKGI
jgi:hypothetical protein